MWMCMCKFKLKDSMGYYDEDLPIDIMIIIFRALNSHLHIYTTVFELALSLSLLLSFSLYLFGLCSCFCFCIVFVSSNGLAPSYFNDLPMHYCWFSLIALSFFSSHWYDTQQISYSTWHLYNLWYSNELFTIRPSNETKRITSSFPFYHFKLFFAKCKQLWWVSK